MDRNSSLQLSKLAGTFHYFHLWEYIILELATRLIESYDYEVGYGSDRNALAAIFEWNVSNLQSYILLCF